jgi:hypothetical protein
MTPNFETTRGHTKINSNWIQYHNIRHITLKLLEENIGKPFQVTGIGSNFLNRTLTAQEIKQ